GRTLRRRCADLRRWQDHRRDRRVGHAPPAGWASRQRWRQRAEIALGLQTEERRTFAWLASEGLGRLIGGTDRWLAIWAGGSQLWIQTPDCCGRSTEYMPVLIGDGWWLMVPIWEPNQTPNPLRRWEPAVPYWPTET